MNEVPELNGSIPMGRKASWLSLAVLCAGCLHGMREVEIPIYGEASKPPVAMVRWDLPKDWVALTPSASRVEYVAPDRRGRCYFRMMKGEVKEEKCTALVKSHAAEVIASWGPGTEVISKREGTARVDFELKRLNPKPEGERVWSSVVCRSGVLAVSSCAAPSLSADAVLRGCQQTVESFDVENASRRAW